MPTEKRARRERARRQSKPVDERCSDSVSESLDKFSLSETQSRVMRSSPVARPALYAGADAVLATTATTTTTVTTSSWTFGTSVVTPAISRPVSSAFTAPDYTRDCAPPRVQLDTFVSSASFARNDERCSRVSRLPQPVCHVANTFASVSDLRPLNATSRRDRQTYRDNARSRRTSSASSESDYSQESDSETRYAKSSRRQTAPLHVKKSESRRKREESESSGNRKNVSTTKSLSSSSEASSRSSARRTAERAQCARSLRDWGLTFSDAENEDADEFLASLDDCRISLDLSDEVILSALPCVLAGNARFWYRGVRTTLTSWREFRDAFRDIFCSELQDDDLQEELRRRTQGKGERVAKYVACFQAIVQHFEQPPPLARQIEMAYAQLHPDYRRYIRRSDARTFADIVKYGKEYERQLRMDERYRHPPPGAKTLLPGAAYAGQPTRTSEVAAAVEKAASPKKKKGSAPPPPSPKQRETASTSSPRKEKSRRRRRGRKGSNKSSSDSSSKSSSDSSRHSSRKSSRHSQSQSSSSSSRESSRRSSSRISRGVEIAALREEVACLQAAQNQLRAKHATDAESMPGKPRRSVPRKSASSNANAFRPQLQEPQPPSFQKHSQVAFSQPPPNAKAPTHFFGLCFVCEEAGHRASECPRRTCYICGQVGHIAAECLWRTPAPVCQVCETPGVTYKNCPSCSSVRELLENAAPGQPSRLLCSAYPR